MGRWIVYVLVIFFSNSYINAQFPLIFSRISTIIKWSDQLFLKGISYKDAADLISDSTGQNLGKILADVEKISIELNTFSNQINQKLDFILNTLLGNLRDNIVLQVRKTELNDLIDAVDRLQTRAIRLKIIGKFSKKRLKRFVELMLWNSNSLPITLERIYQLVLPSTHYIVPEFSQLMLKDAQDNLRYDCNKYSSAQQRYYYIYIHIILAEMKGLATLTYVYSIQQMLDRSYNYTVELENSKKLYQSRVNKYYERLSNVMAAFPREIYRCDVNPLKRGEDYIELYKFSRAVLLNEQNLPESQRKLYYTNGHCTYSCPQLDGTNFDTGTPLSGRTTYNCQYFGEQVRVCPAKGNSHREYMWWKNASGTFGRDEICYYQNDASGFEEEYPISEMPFLTHVCDECVCSVDMNTTDSQKSDPKAIASISLTPQISDIANNMIVTGVQFVTCDNVIHLQIQQNKFLPGGIAADSSVWKLLVTEPGHIPNNYDNKCNGKFQYTAFNHKLKALNLDDVMVPDNYVVTGVKFARDLSRPNFVLSVYATPFDMNTGLLSPNASAWFIPGEYTSRPFDYSRRRYEIKLNEPDDPTRCENYNYDAETNKFIKFVHTDIRKDAGQNTIPFFDAQSVETLPPFPLNGIGLYYKYKKGCGGYVAPRLYTIDIAEHIRQPLH